MTSPLSPAIRSENGSSAASNSGYKTIIQDLPNHPSGLNASWVDVTHPEQRANTLSREYLHTESNLRVRFDEGKPGANGFEGINHWHVMNPNSQGSRDLYLDVNGNPVARGSKASHIVPQ